MDYEHNLFMEKDAAELEKLRRNEHFKIAFYLFVGAAVGSAVVCVVLHLLVKDWGVGLWIGFAVLVAAYAAAVRALK